MKYKEAAKIFDKINICNKNTNTKKKVVFVGDGAVGKTRLFRSLFGLWEERYVPTIFEEIETLFSYSTALNQFQSSLILYDTAGQEDFDRMRPLAYPNTDFFMLIFFPFF